MGQPESWPKRPLIAGILNITPDSFSDGGRFERWEDAVAQGLEFVRQGADLLDVGGESTRPGAHPVSTTDEKHRVLPVVRALADEAGIPISIDTRKPEVADLALEAGATWINDVGGLRDEQMAEVAAYHGAGLILMHMRGEPRTMQSEIHYDDVVEEVASYLRHAALRAEALGVARTKIWIDPGIGFGKEVAHNLQLLRNLDRFAELGYPLMVGASRKSFIGRLSGDPVGERIGGSLAAAGMTMGLPHAVVRVHDVAATRQYLQLRAALRG